MHKDHLAILASPSIYGLKIFNSPPTRGGEREGREKREEGKEGGARGRREEGEEALWSSCWYRSTFLVAMYSLPTDFLWYSSHNQS